MFESNKSMRLVFGGILISFFLLVFNNSQAQTGMAPDPKINENLQTTISFNHSGSAHTYDFNDTDWYYIAFTKPISGNGALYIDGEYVGDIQWDNIAYDHMILNIGVTYQTALQSFFSGSIDEIRVTNTIKDAAAIKNYYISDQPFTSEASTAFIWRFDEGTGDKFYDEDSKTSGTLFGAPLWVDGKFGKAIKYDGINDRARLNVDLIEYQITYELWVKFDGEVRSESQTIIQPYGGASSSIDMQIQQTLIEPEPPAREDVVFDIPDLQTLPGETVIVPVTVEKFIDILTVQQTIAWDPSVFQYIGVQDFNLGDLDGSSFNLFEAGKLAMSWSPADLNTIALEDEAVIFNILLQAIGAGGTSSNIEFTDDPTVREVSDGESNVLSVVYEDGSLSIQDQVGLTGYIRTQSGSPVPDLEVQLSGGMDETTKTDEFGNYKFTVSPGQEYTITPVFDGEFSADDGVTTLDLVIMKWYIMGTKNLMSNYDLIASDVNQSGSLTTMDVAQTRAVILHRDETFIGRNAVEFISYEYSGTPDIFNYKNSITTTPTGPESDLNFTAVKLGDAGRNWVVNQSGGRYENLEILEIIVQQKLETDALVNVSLKSKEFDKVVGVQFTLEWDPEMYQFNEIDHKQIQFNINDGLLDQGKMTFSWNSEKVDGLHLHADEILSELMFTKVGNGKDSPISITSSITPALAFNSSLDMMKISQSNIYGELIESSKLSVYPNPSVSSISISGLETNESLQEFQIINSMGQVMKSGSMKGQTNISIEELSGGLYFLNLKSELGQTRTLNFLKR